MRVLVVVPTLGQRDLEPLARAIAEECRGVGEPLVLHNGAPSDAVADLCTRNGVSYRTHLPLGYSEIRNEAIRLATEADFDVLAMIDDDEMPSPGWLRALVAPFGSGADVVVGPVTTTWPDGTPARFTRSALPRPASSRPDGFLDIDLRSGNCAIRLSALGDLRFDEEFNATGGEDTALFRRLRAAGARAYWAGSASVAELVDRDRVRLRYFAGRSSAQGRSFAAVQKLVPRLDDERPVALLRRRSVRSARLAWWAVSRRNVSHLLESACEVAFVIGYVSGRLGR